jgi:hypothetical protein
MKEMMKKSESLYYAKDFREFMRSMQQCTDEDFKEKVPEIKEMITNSNETNPLLMFEMVMSAVEQSWDKPTPLPTNNEYHHFVIPGVIIASLKNLGYAFTTKDIEEGLTRGEKFAGGSCGFAGICGGANSFGIVLSIVNKTNPIHDHNRSEIMRLTADVLSKISNYERRCCKRSSYQAFESTVAYLQSNGFPDIAIGKVECQWNTKNKTCMGNRCPYFPKNIK